LRATFFACSMPDGNGLLARGFENLNPLLSIAA
jgi:hypothetical protein